MKRLSARVVFMVAIVMCVSAITITRSSVAAQTPIILTPENEYPIFAQTAVGRPPGDEQYPTSSEIGWQIDSDAQSLYRIFINKLDMLGSEVIQGKNVTVTKIRSQDNFAYALVQEVDRTTLKVISDYAFLILAIRGGNDQWTTIAPRNSERNAFNQLLARYPDQLLDEASKAYYHSFDDSLSPNAINMSGYKLPWPADQTAVLTRKESHPTPVGQLDFDIQGRSADGDVYAAKPGKVVFVKESSNVGGSCSTDWRYANMIVIQHSSGEYSWYVHLRYDSVTVNMDESVEFGQKIAVEGNTGQACSNSGGTGVHLHFMTSTGHTTFPPAPVPPNSAPWATGITTTDFEEVSWDQLHEGSPYESENRSGGGSTCSNPNADQVTLYVRAGFDSNGQCVTRGIGEYSNSGSIGLPDNSIRSIKVGGNVQARLCKGENFNDCHSFNSDNGDLNGTAVGYDTSSVKVEKKPDPPPPTCGNPNADQVTLYVRTGFDSNGQCVTRGIGEYSNSGSIGLPDNSIRSIKVGGNVKLTLCASDNFGSPCTTYESDNGDIGQLGNGVSSAKVENRPPPSSNDTVKIFDGTNYSDELYGYKDSGLHNLPDYANNKASSIWLAAGWSVRVYRDNNGQGDQTCINSSDSDLSNNTYNNGVGVNESISSIHVYTQEDCPAMAPGIPTLASPANGAVFNRNTSITLSWNTASNANNYYAEMWGGPNASYNSGWTGGTGWAVGQPWGGAYQWRVKSRNSADAESGWSETRSFTVKYGSPSSLTATAVSGSQINLSWNASADAPGNIDGYRIYRGGTAIATVGSSTTNYQNTGLSCGTSSNYTVKAYKGSVESDASNTASATTSQCLPDLVPFAPAGYEYPVVPTSIKGTKTSGPLFAGQSLFLDWYFKNIGGGPATGDFMVRVMIDNTTYVDYPFSNYNAGIGNGFDDWYQVHQEAGCQIVKMVVDPDNTIFESDEDNNTWQKEFCWQEVTGWWGEYFNNETLSGDPAFVRDDPVIDFAWYGESPAPEINHDHFSIRWTRRMDFEEGTYQFIIFRDNGARLWIDDVLVFEEWDSGRYERKFEYDVSSGPHNIRYEVNEIDGWADARLGWELIVPCNDQNEPNDGPDTATEMSFGSSRDGDICPVIDEDYYGFEGSSGQTITAGAVPGDGSLFYAQLTLYGPDGSTVLAGGNCGATDEGMSIEYTLPADGRYFIKVDECSDYSDYRYFYTLTLTAIGADRVYYLSPTASVTLDSSAYKDEDILAYDDSTDAWGLFFDGSDVGLATADVSAFELMDDGSILLSLDKPMKNLPGLRNITADDSDILRFTPTSIGATTAGTFAIWFDGSDVGLTTTGEKIDAIAFAPNGKLVISTGGAASVTGTSGVLKGKDEDLLVFNDTSFGNTTAGTWNLYFDAGDVSTKLMDIVAAGIDSNGDILFAVDVKWVFGGLTINTYDIARCVGPTTGANSGCDAVELFWEGAQHGFNNKKYKIDGFGLN